MVIIGVHLSASSDNAEVGNGEVSLRNAKVENVENSLIPNSNHADVPFEARILTDESMDHPQVEIPENPPADHPVKRSTVGALRGILKKPRRQSRDINSPEIQDDSDSPPQCNGDLDLRTGGNIPEVSSQYSDEVQNPHESTTNQPPKTNGIELSSYKIQRGSLQMAAFDRVLFAKRGAELRNEYMRDFQ